MQDFKKLAIWRQGHTLALDVYRLTASFPKSEIYGIVSQIRRAVVSVPTNIAEGSGRDGKNDFKRFIDIAIGSLKEVEYLTILSKDLDFISGEQYEKLTENIIELQKMIAGFRRSLIQKQ